MADTVLERYYICYMDVLGYRDKIKSFGEVEYLEVIRRLFGRAISSINKLSTELKEHGREIKYRVFKLNDELCLRDDMQAVE